MGGRSPQNPEIKTPKAKPLKTTTPQKKDYLVKAF